MKKLVTLSLFFILGIECQSADQSIGSVSELRLNDNAVASWIEDRERYAMFDTSTFYDIIDGGAPVYNDQGLIDGFTQTLEKSILPDTFTCQVYAMDFGTQGNARTMLDTIKSIQGMSVMVPGFNLTEAIARPILGGYFSCATFDRFYIEVTVSGYSDTVLALQEVQVFLKVFKGKIPVAVVRRITDRRIGKSGVNQGADPSLDLRGRRFPA